VPCRPRFPVCHLTSRFWNCAGNTTGVGFLPPVIGRPCRKSPLNRKLALSNCRPKAPVDALVNTGGGWAKPMNRAEVSPTRNSRGIASVNLGPADERRRFRPVAVR